MIMSKSAFLLVKGMDQFIRSHNVTYCDYPEVHVSISLHHAPDLMRFHVLNKKTAIMHEFKVIGHAVRCANRIISTGED
jgi:hypothetical protein